MKLFQKYKKQNYRCVSIMFNCQSIFKILKIKTCFGYLWVQNNVKYIMIYENWNERILKLDFFHSFYIIFMIGT